MPNRRITYGYTMQEGEFKIEPKEANIVKRIFTTYLAGASYQGIAEMLNMDEIPFSSEAPIWNKHKVKRVLENPRYMGAKGYPPIIEAETFAEVQLLIASKTAGYKPKQSTEVKTANSENQTELREQKVVFEPTLEVMQIDNTINRGLERMDSPEEVIRLILKGITARYMCCG